MGTAERHELTWRRGGAAREGSVREGSARERSMSTGSVRESSERESSVHYKPLWIEEPATRFRMPDPVRTAAVRAVIIVAITLIQAMTAFLCTLAGSWLAFPMVISSVAGTVVATWGVLDVWVTRQVWRQRNGVISVPASTARALRRERRRARKQARRAERGRGRERGHGRIRESRVRESGAREGGARKSAAGGGVQDSGSTGGTRESGGLREAGALRDTGGARQLSHS
ncbi:hypothetical protein ACFVT5_33295 [Streptomyces sp. NPDC058001]|uniref:hypothetical protein n=1 Tax=Streptomyces sp. NPDC058001 TaxID=3346300 RepID=UPI0036EFCCB2